MKNKIKLIIVSTALLLLPGFFNAVADELPASAAQPADQKSALERWAYQDYMFGDWGGLRTDLSKHGVDFEFFYAGSGPMNLDGGLKRGAIYQGALLMSMTLDSEKLLGYEGGQFYMSSLWLNGEKPFSDKYVGDLNKVNLLDFPNSARLWEVSYEQKFFNDKFSIKVGELSIDHDFIVAQYYNSIAGLTMLNQTFFYPTMAFNVWDQPFFPKGDHSLASTPYATPGVRLRYDPTDHYYVQFGAYGGAADTSDSGTDWSLRGKSGALLYFETGLKINQAKGDQGPPGNLKLGGYYHMDDFYDLHDGAYVAFDNVAQQMTGMKFSDIYAFYYGSAPKAFTEPRKYSGNYGLYLLADQTLWREKGKDDPAQQGLVGFFRLGYAPPDRNLADFGADGGLVYKGLIPGRDYDTLAIAGSYLHMSDDLRKAQRELNTLAVDGLGQPAPFTKLADYEGVLEISYKAQLTAWWTLEPDIQRVFHPGGYVQAATPDAWVFIIQTTLRF